MTEYFSRRQRADRAGRRAQRAQPASRLCACRDAQAVLMRFGDRVIRIARPYVLASMREGSKAFDSKPMAGATLASQLVCILLVRQDVGQGYIGTDGLALPRTSWIRATASM